MSFIEDLVIPSEEEVIPGTKKTQLFFIIHSFFILIAIQGAYTLIMGYGFFGQLLWMFGGILLLIHFGKANHVRNLAPGMAGSLSHSGLTGACTAGDLGHEAAARAPIMINIPFFGHIFVFTILAFSAAKGALLSLPSALVVIAGIVLTSIFLRHLSKAGERNQKRLKDY